MSEFEIKVANKKAKRLRVGLSASSGSGKTLGALLIAKGLTGDWSKICIIDTERDSASLYANTKNDVFSIGEFHTLSLKKPYTPDRFVQAILAAEKDHDAIIIDSITHEWSGPGGCLDIHAGLGGTFQDWGKVTPMHNNFIDAILTSSAHVFCTVRRKEDYGMEQTNRGLIVVKKGLGEQTRDGFTYEMDLVLEIENENHMAHATKDRTMLFTDNEPFLITEETGNKLKEWASNGRSSLDDAMDNLRSARNRSEVAAVHNTYKNELKDNEDYNALLKLKSEEFPKK